VSSRRGIKAWRTPEGRGSHFAVGTQRRLDGQVSSRLDMVYGGSLNQKLKAVETRGVLKRKIFGGKFLDLLGHKTFTWTSHIKAVSLIHAYHTTATSERGPRAYRFPARP